MPRVVTALLPEQMLAGQVGILSSWGESLTQSQLNRHLPDHQSFPLTLFLFTINLL